MNVETIEPLEVEPLNTVMLKKVCQFPSDCSFPKCPCPEDD